MALNDEDQEEGSLTERVHRQSLDRLLALSDGVFAIAITLLVLELTTPELIDAASHGDFGHLLEVSTTHIITYAIGFAVIALYWVGHRRIFLLIERTDALLTFLNMALLMCIAFMPFPTALLGHHPGRTAVLFYAGTQTVAGTVNLAMWLHAIKGPRLISPISSRRLFHHTLRAAVTPTVFLLSMVVALYQPMIAQLFWGAIIVFLALLDRVFPAESESERVRIRHTSR